MSGPPNPPGPYNNSAVWAAKADTDLRGAEILAADTDPPWDLICYHAQQAAEKYLKAVLVAHGQQPPKVHDLSKLLTSAMAFDASLVNLSQDAVSLTPSQ